MSVNEAIERLEQVHLKRRASSNLFGESAAMLREAKEIMERLQDDHAGRTELILRVERWLKE